MQGGPIQPGLILGLEAGVGKKPFSPQAGGLGHLPVLLLGVPSLICLVARLPVCDSPSQLGMGVGTTQH